MFELHQIGARSYYIQSPAKMGLIKTGEHEACLIDSGNDKDAGRKVRQILDANGWTLKAILGFDREKKAWQKHWRQNQYGRLRSEYRTYPTTNDIRTMEKVE